MSLPEIETKALLLPRTERARLAETLLRSLDDLSEHENERLWVEEAQRRDRELDEGTQLAKPASEVFRQLRVKIG
jgi:hypothetical protein